MTGRLLARQALEDAQKAKQFAEKFIRETSAESGRHGPGNLWGPSGSDAGGTGTGGGDSVLGQWHRLRYLGAEHIAVEIGTFLKIRYDDGNMIELTDHD